MSKLFRHIRAALILFFAITAGSIAAQNVMMDEFGIQADNSAMLEINDSTSGFFSQHKGLLIPRMTQAQRNAIINPANGVLIYQLDVDSGYHYNRGTALMPDWVKMIDETQISYPNIETVLIQGNDANGQQMMNLNSLSVDINALATNQFQVNESAGSTSNLQISDLASGATTTDGFFLSLISGNAELRNHENGAITFETNAMERMRLTNTGLVVGNTVTAELLDISGSARINRLNINSTYTFPTDVGTNGQLITTDGLGTLSWSAFAPDDFGNHTAYQNIEMRNFYLSNNGGNEGLYIDTNGNAGIGTDSLRVKFTVYDPTFPLLRVTASTGGPNNIVDAAVIELSENNPASFDASGYGFKIRYVGNGSNTDRLQFYSKNNGTEDLVLLLKRTNRNVGIGMQEPASRFHVEHSNSELDGVSINNLADNDSWHFYTADTNGLLLYYNNALVGAFSSTTGAYTSLSDRKSKRDISEVESIIPTLCKLEIFEYHYNHQSLEEKKSIGVLAQQLQSHFPSLVSESINDVGETTLSVNYFGLNALAAAGSAEQYTELEQLESRIEELEKKIKARKK